MKVSIIAAHDLSKVIGYENRIPWHISDDLKRFKKLTSGKAVIMGRKTFESIGKPLPKRINIVITGDVSAFYEKWGQEPWFTDSLLAVSTYEEAISVARGRACEHCFVIGGTSVYSAALKHADDMYLTVVFAHHEGDAFFPPYSSKDWKLVDFEEIPGDENEETPDYAFYYLERRKPGVAKRIIDKYAAKIPGFLRRWVQPT